MRVGVAAGFSQGILVTCGLAAAASIFHFGGNQTMDRFEQLKTKYAPVLDLVKQIGVSLSNLHVENDKLVMKGRAHSEDVKNRVWNKIKEVDPNWPDISCDLAIDPSLPPPPPEAQTYTVAKGDSLWKIAEKFYGKGALYPKIIAANPNKLKDEKSVIHPGDVLTIPPA
jgi:LysM repeat protein